MNLCRNNLYFASKKKINNNICKQIKYTVVDKQTRTKEKRISGVDKTESDKGHAILHLFIEVDPENQKSH